MQKPCTNHAKAIGNHAENTQKPFKNHAETMQQKTIQKSIQKQCKHIRNHTETMQKPYKNHAGTMKNHTEAIAGYFLQTDVGLLQAGRLCEATTNAPQRRLAIRPAR